MRGDGSKLNAANTLAATWRRLTTQSERLEGEDRAIHLTMRSSGLHCPCCDVGYALATSAKR